MATLFSKYFGINPIILDNCGFLDPYIDVDTPLFIDPLLISKSENNTIADEGSAEFEAHFKQVISLLEMSERQGDPAWKAAEKLLSLKEPAENGLGYGRGSRSGASRPQQIRDQLLRTIQEVLRLGSKNPAMMSLMGFIEDGIGADTISDFTTYAMLQSLAKSTNEFCVNSGIEVHDNSLSTYPLPNLQADGKGKPVILIPRDILRDLPVANDWSDVWYVVSENKRLRDSVSAIFHRVAEATQADKKFYLRKALFKSKDIFDLFIDQLQGISSSYDENEDVLGYYAFRRELLNEDREIPRKKYDFRKGPKRPFENDLICLRPCDSSFGCGPKRAEAGWLNLRSVRSAIRPI